MWWNSTWAISNPKSWCSATLNMSANLENSAVATGLKRSDFIPIPKKGNAKERLNYHTIALISHTSKVMLKILQANLQQYMNWGFPDVQAGFRKGREKLPEIKLPKSVGTQKKQEISRKKISTSDSLIMLKPLLTTLLIYWLYQSLWLCWSQKTVENS